MKNDLCKKCNVGIEEAPGGCGCSKCEIDKAFEKSQCKSVLHSKRLYPIESIVIHKYKYGIIIETPVAITFLELFFDSMLEEDYDIIDTHLSQHYKGVCITNKPSAKCWKEEIGLE